MPISSSTNTKAMTKFTAVGSSTPKRLFIEFPLALQALSGRPTRCQTG
jgi:hypothetical protein